MNLVNFGAVIISMVVLAGCYAGETFDIVAMRRASDGAIAECSSGTYGVSIFGQDNKAPLNVARCVAACEKIGFVVVKSFPRPDLVIATEEVDGIPETKRPIRETSRDLLLTDNDRDENSYSFS